jgi:hypothetical protein
MDLAGWMVSPNTVSGEAAHPLAGRRLDMKRTIWIFMAIIFSTGLAWMALMRTINTRVTQLSVQVAGNVERVVFYQAAEPGRILAEIHPQGKPVEMPVSLPNTAQRSLLRQGAPAQYYFVAEQAGQRYQSPRSAARQASPAGMSA